MTLGFIAIACSSNDGPSSSGPNGSTGGGGSVGGRSATGGSSATATGGATNSSTGGQGAAQGGTSAATSSSASTGGAATGGTSSGATGGAATGGKSTTAATGGGATGGKTSTNATGGAATGGKTSTTATGGAENGGKSSTGGTSTVGGESSTGGSSAAAGGTSGTGGSSSGGGVIPTKVTTGYQFKYDYNGKTITMVVNPTIGARIASLTVGTTNIIQPHTATTYSGSDSSNNTGITFWTSPQSSWNPTWPPVAAIDGNAYTVTDDGATSGHLVLTGAADSSLGAGVVKDISVDSATGWITVKYTIKATKAIQAAAWQIARVPRAGLVFFPCTTSPIKQPSVTWTLSQTSGYDWIDDKSQTSVSAASDGSKYVVNGAAVSGKDYTLLGYALSGNLLLLKYPDASTFATGEGDTEVYPGAGYMELEAQGNYGSIAANSSSPSWSVQMRVDTIDSAVTVASGSATLISFAEQQAAL